jgi:DNA-binding MarR family transcriptional regulator
MTETLTPAPLFGQVVGEARGALAALLNDVLARDGRVTREDWLAMNLIASRGGASDRDEVCGALAAALDATPASISTLLERLESARVIRPIGGQVALTAEGEALHRGVRATVQRTTGDVLRDLEPGDVETTIRVLRTATERAGTLRAR